MHCNVFKDSLGLISHYLNLPCVPWQALGQVGVVIKEFSSGDVRVAVNGKRWTMNPCCLLPAPNDKSIVTPDTGTTTIMSLIIRTIQLSEHPPFPGKMINYCHLNTHVWNYYSNIRTLTPCRARMGVAERLPAFDSLCGARMGVAERLLAFDSLCGATARVTILTLIYGTF